MNFNNGHPADAEYMTCDHEHMKDGIATCPPKEKHLETCDGDCSCSDYFIDAESLDDVVDSTKLPEDHYQWERRLLEKINSWNDSQGFTKSELLLFIESRMRLVQSLGERDGWKQGELHGLAVKKEPNRIIYDGDWLTIGDAPSFMLSKKNAERLRDYVNLIEEAQIGGGGTNAK
jgi:hypothetical protein